MGKVLVAIDPGVVSMGLCIFEEKDDKPVDAAAFDISRFGGAKGRSPEASVVRLVNQLREYLRPYSGRIERVACEKMQFYGSARGIAAAGDVLEVSFCVGMVAALAYELKTVFCPVPVQAWKGQLSKDQVATRILKRWGIAREEFEESSLYGLMSWPVSHDWDAAGIGLFVRGKL